MLSSQLRLVLSVIICITFAASAKAQTIVGSFPSPSDEPRGLAWDGEYLWCADADADSVYRLDPSDGTILSSFPFSINSSYGGMTWSEDSNIWIANGSYTYKADPNTGQSLYYFHCVYG